MTNALEEKLIEQMDKGVDTLTNKFVRDINKDQVSKQSATVSTVDDFDRHMWDSVHEDALTGDSLPTQIENHRPQQLFPFDGVVRVRTECLAVWRVDLGCLACSGGLCESHAPNLCSVGKSTETDPFHGRGFGLEEASLIICVGSENTRWFHFLQFGSALGGPMY